MNVLFLTLLDFNSLNERNIYTDLLREFVRNNHSVYVVSPIERRKKTDTHLIEEKNTVILKQKIGNTQKTNVIEKGISTVTIESLFKKGIKKYFSDVKFDLVMYSTPPITLCDAIEFVKKRDNARTYLLLKDIFPQNSVDIGMLGKTGVKGALYKKFRKKEKRLYALSDKIGCMSEANVRYVLEHNLEVSADKVEVCPNSIEPVDMSCTAEERQAIREKYNLPFDKRIFVYGGNLGMPQGIDFLIDCMENQSFDDVIFLIIGNGTEYGKLKKFVDETDRKNVMLMKFLPREDYDRMIGACDVGMIFLDHRFTIPNFPSRLLSYTQAKLPVLTVTDPNTDIGEVVENNGFGVRCLSNDAVGFIQAVKKISSADLTRMGNNGFEHMNENYTVKKSYEIIMSSVEYRGGRNV